MKLAAFSDRNKLVLLAAIGSICLALPAGADDLSATIKLGHRERDNAVGAEIIGGFFEQVLDAGDAVGASKTQTFSARRLQGPAGDGSEPLRLLALYTVTSARKPFIHDTLPFARFALAEPSGRAFPKDVAITLTRAAGDRLRVEARSADKSARPLLVHRVQPREIRSANARRKLAALPPIAEPKARRIRDRIGVRTAGGVFKEIIAAGFPAGTHREHEVQTSQQNQTTALLTVYRGKSDAIEGCKVYENYAITGLAPKEKRQRIRVAFDVNQAGRLQLSASVVGDPRTRLQVETLAAYRRRAAREGLPFIGERLAPDKALRSGLKGSMPISPFGA